MKKQLLSIAILAFATAAYGQVGINTTTPATTLDIIAKNPTGTTTAVDGLMIPRVSRQRAQSMSSVPTSTMIYVNDVSTGAASGIAVNIDAVGFYYYNGLAWTKMGSGSGSSTSVTTLYSGDGSLAGNRTVSQGANTLAFTGTAANAFSVDGNTFSVDAANHRIGLGITSPATRLDIAGTGGSDDDIFIRSYSAVSNAGAVYFYKAGGTLASPASVATGENLGEFNFGGYDGTAGRFNAGIRAYVNGAVSTGTVPVDLQFSTGATAPAERMRIASTGNIGIATSAPAATLDVAAKASTGTGTAVDGILIPRVDRQRAQSMTSVPASTLVYVNNISTGSQSGPAANIDAIGFYYSDGTNWQKLGGSSSAPAYQNVRGNVNVLSSSTLSYTVQPTDYMVVTTAGSGVTITLPALTAADAGRVVLLYNDNSGTFNNTYSGIDAGSTSPNSAKGRTATLVWTGTKWITASAQ